MTRVRLVGVLVIAALTTTAGCGGGGDDGQTTTLGENRTPRDVAQCLVANGWDNMELGFVGSTGEPSYIVDSPSDGTPITLTASDIDTKFNGSTSGSFRINGTDTALDVDVGGISITDEERDQVYACAASAQPVATD